MNQAPGKDTIHFQNQSEPPGDPLIEQAIAPVSDLLFDLRQGRPVIIIDDENRENEGDLVIVAEHVTPPLINFMIRECGGFVCLAMAEELTERLALPLQPKRHVSATQAPFTVSIEAREGVTTGVSAADRARTILAAVNPQSGPEDIATPGHIFPLRARNGGVFERCGHTEAGVDLARLAGAQPAAVICEIMNEDGTMARLPDLQRFAARNGLKIGTIADLVSYREREGS